MPLPCPIVSDLKPVGEKKADFICFSFFCLLINPCLPKIWSYFLISRQSCLKANLLGLEISFSVILDLKGQNTGEENTLPLASSHFTADNSGELWVNNKRQPKFCPFLTVCCLVFCRNKTHNQARQLRTCNCLYLMLNSLLPFALNITEE